MSTSMADITNYVIDVTMCVSAWRERLPASVRRGLFHRPCAEGHWFGSPGALAVPVHRGECQCATLVCVVAMCGIPIGRCLPEPRHADA